MTANTEVREPMTEPSGTPRMTDIYIQIGRLEVIAEEMEEWGNSPSCVEVIKEATDTLKAFAALANGAPAGREPDACPHAAPFVYCEECKVDPCPLGFGPKPVFDVGATMIAQRRKDYLFRNTPRCPACDDEQVQCVDWMRVPSWWRCRECQHGFDYEPATPSPVPDAAEMRERAAKVCEDEAGKQGGLVALALDAVASRIRQLQQEG